MATFQILSDLHLENPRAYDVFDIPPKAPYLALLGDIGSVKDDGLFAFLEAQLQKFQLVFFLLGNHEPYDSNWTAVKNRVRKDQVSQITISNPHQKIIIFTHHSPTLVPKATDPAHVNSPISSGSRRISVVTLVGRNHRCDYGHLGIRITTAITLNNALGKE
ncbi:hypothetical protein BJX68DRAFT_267887 [Aspergillus pseudodeflectus]|uniref:Calcineurin-like phosphoesterase domain-containing protein n=1 Tax=Aspergillus pseudodeflectus TaxID=176178 RepID=A0ABR4K6M1_9EURO